jgi:hypothetical protein
MPTHHQTLHDPTFAVMASGGPESPSKTKRSRAEMEEGDQVMKDGAAHPNDGRSLDARFEAHDEVYAQTL